MKMMILKVLKLGLLLLNLGSLICVSQSFAIGHFRLNIDADRGSPLESSSTAAQDFKLMLRNEGFGSGDYKNYLFLAGEALDRFDQSECKSSCDSKVSNCGWGAVSKSYLNSQLAKCGFDNTFKRLPYYKDKDTNITMTCHLGEEEYSFDSTLKSLEQLIGHDCNNLRGLGGGDGAFCNCVVSKSNNHNSLFYTPLNSNDLKSIKEIARKSYYKKKVTQSGRALYAVSRVLSVAYQDEDLRKLIDETEGGTSCLPGGFQRYNSFNMKARDDLKGEIMCGAQGSKVFDEIFEQNMKECAEQAKCRAAWGELDKTKSAETRREGAHPDITGPESLGAGNGFWKMLHRQANAFHNNEYNRGETSEDQDLSLKERCSKEKSTDTTSDTKVSKSVGCITGATAQPSQMLSYIEELSQIIATFRKARKAGKFSGDDGHSQFVASMPKNENMEALAQKVQNDYRVLDMGVFKNHAYQASPMAKMLELVDNVIPKEFNLTSEPQKLEAYLKSKMADVQKSVVKEALADCHKFHEEAINLCQYMDVAISDQKALPLSDLKDFSPAAIAQNLHGRDKELGTLMNQGPEALRRKFEQYRCAGLMEPGAEDDDIFEMLGGDLLSAANPDSKEYLTPLEVLNEDSGAGAPNTAVVDATIIQRNPQRADADTRWDLYSKLNDPSLRWIAENMAKGHRTTTDNSRKMDVSGFNSDLKKDKFNKTLAVTQPVKKPLNIDGNNQTVASDLAAINAAAYESTIGKRATKDTPSAGASEALERSKQETDDRLDVISRRLAELAKARETNKTDLSAAGSELKAEEKKDDPEYQKMLIEKLQLEREIAALKREKLDKVSKKAQFEKALAEIEESESQTPAAANNATIGSAVGNTSKATTKGGAGGGTSGARAPASFSTAGSISSAGGGGSGPISSDQKIFTDAPYVVTLYYAEEQAIKEKFDELELKDVASWQSSGKPPVYREGNIYYELEVIDGKIALDALMRPILKKALNGVNVPGLKKETTDLAAIPKGAEQVATLKRIRAKVEDLNALLGN